MTRRHVLPCELGADDRTIEKVDSPDVRRPNSLPSLSNGCPDIARFDVASMGIQAAITPTKTRVISSMI
jgi:hypothetical protein